MATDCSGIREDLLTADPMELEGVGDSAVAKHVRECERCASVAEKILAAQAEMGAALASMRPRASAETALLQARARAVRRRLVPTRVAAALAAAAALGALWMIGARERVDWQAPDEMAALAAGTRASEPLIEAPGRSLMVMETDNPNVRVIWLY